MAATTGRLGTVGAGALAVVVVAPVSAATMAIPGYDLGINSGDC
jgi:hypothetical protein